MIPHSRYNRILDSLDNLTNKDAQYMFLAYRCDQAFLELYIARHTGFIESLLSFGSYMGYVREVSVITRLHELNLLPEEARQAFVNRTRELAINTPDSDWIDCARIRAVFTDSEVRSLLELVKEWLIPNVDSTISDWMYNYDNSCEPDSYFEPLKDAFQTYRDQFEEDEEAQNALKSALSDIDNEIDELLSERENPYEGEEEYYRSSSSFEKEEERSIFDDVDD